MSWAPTEVASVTPAFARSFSSLELADSSWAGPWRSYLSARTDAGAVSLCGPSSSRPPLPPVPPNRKYAPTPMAATTATEPMMIPAFLPPLPPEAGGWGGMPYCGCWP